jgi:hypothetical protein
VDKYAHCHRCNGINGYCYTDYVADRSADGRADGDRYAVYIADRSADRRTNQYSNSNTDRNSNGDTNRDTDRHTNGHANRNADGYAYLDADTRTRTLCRVFTDDGKG